MMAPVAGVIVATLVSAASPAHAAASAGPAPVRIYVFATPPAAESTPTEEEQGLQDSVRDLEELLRKKKGFVVAASADEAQVVVEIFNREERNAAQGGFGGASFTKFRETIVRVRVKAGTDQSELKGVGQGSWGSAAKDLVERLQKWVKNHVMPTFS